MSNNAQVTKGFDIMRQYLVAFIVRELRAEGGDDWWTSHVLAILYDNQRLGLPSGKGMTDSQLMDELDIARCLALINAHWNSVFRRKMTREQRTWVNELVDVRNKWAHSTGEGFSDDDTWRALDTMARLMEPIDAQSAEDLRALARQTMYGTTGPSTAPETEVVAPKATGSITPATRATYSGGLKPWRIVAEPHPDVARGVYRQAEFAADLAQVARGTASSEYQDPADFFARTFITEGMEGLLLQAVQRVSGLGGEPVIQLKTAFGGGKTHSMLALYHLLKNGSRATAYAGVRAVLAKAGISTLPDTRVVTLVGIWLDPSKSRRDAFLPGHTINTIWGEMTAQLAIQANDLDLYNLIKEPDKKGVAPGAATLVEILDRVGPCLILIDELVAYARKIYGQSDLPAGTFESVLSFIQELTEACRASKNSLVVASIPESEMEAGGDAGIQALRRIERVFGRMEAIWKPVVADEGFEIVRRRLFKDIVDVQTVDAVCRAYSRMYQDNPSDFPIESKEVAYLERLKACYPIHPEVFDRLYEDWATLENFQRTRGVLRFMASVIRDLWEKGNQELLIMPGSINFGDSIIREELTRYLLEGKDAWNTVIDKEVDGARALSVQIDRQQTRFGQIGAARRVARTIALGSAPDVRGQRMRGLQDVRIRLGVVQPSESIPVYNDALNKLQAELSHLYSATQRYWFDTRPTLRKTVQDRASQIDLEVAAYEVQKLLNGWQRPSLNFAGVHPGPMSTGDVPDDDRVRLVLLPPQQSYRRNGATSKALVLANDILTSRGSAPRLYRNMLAFMAPDSELIAHTVDEMSMCMAWQSVLDEEDSLNLDAAQRREVRQALAQSKETVDRRLREAYCWLLVPTQEGTQPIAWEELRLAGGENPVEKASRHMKNDGSLITDWSPYILKMELDRLLWTKTDAISIKDLWEFLAQYCYLPRIKEYRVLEEAIAKGLHSDAYFAYAEGRDSDGKYVDLHLNKPLIGSPALTGWLVKVEVARAQLEAEAEARRQKATEKEGIELTPPITIRDGGAGQTTIEKVVPTPPARETRRYYATADLDPLRIASGAAQIDDEILRSLAALPGARVSVSLEIDVDVPNAIPDDVIRAVRMNSEILKLRIFDFEER